MRETSVLTVSHLAGFREGDWIELTTYKGVDVLVVVEVLEPSEVRVRAATRWELVRRWFRFRWWGLKRAMRRVTGS